LEANEESHQIEYMKMRKDSEDMRDSLKREKGNSEKIRAELALTKEQFQEITDQARLANVSTSPIKAFMR
jgi:hypothetical protein